MPYTTTPQSYETKEYGTAYGNTILVNLDEDLGPDACCTMRRAIGHSPICDNPAEWLAVLGCCGYRKLVCTAHREPTTAVWPVMFTCARCQTVYPMTIATIPV